MEEVNMRNKDFRYFNIAKEVSQLSKMGKIKIGAVIVKKHHDYLHAETDAILHSNRKELDGASIYLYREKRRRTSCYVPPVRGVHGTSSVSRD